MVSVLTNRLRRFRREDDGTVTVEMLLILPVVLWAFLATFVFFDAFSSRTAAQRAAYTISDSIGRQQNSALTPAELDGFNQIFAYLARSRHVTQLRVSSIVWNPIDEEYNVVWSYATGNGMPLTTDRLTPELIDRLPVLARADGEQSRESVYLTETIVEFVPVMESLPLVGGVLRQQTLYNVIVARPRFSPQLRFNDGTGIFGETFPTCDDGPDLCSNLGGG